jgi:catechol 2,3-dioxygenase-like lactoylglutathione lyase family enzyme
MSEPAACLSLVTLGVSDLAKSTAFYEALGFRRKSRGADGVAFFEAGGVILSLWPTVELAKDAEIASTNPSGFRGMSLAWNCTSAAEVDRALARATAAGATLIRSAQTVFWGGYTAYFADPDGHLWEIAHNPQFPFSADGRLLLPD